MLDKYLSDFNQMRKTNGLGFTIKYYKLVRLYCTRYICGKPLTHNNDNLSIKENFPSRVFYLKELIDSGNPRLLRFVLTILVYPRSIKPLKSENKYLIPKFDSITDPYKGKDYTIPADFIIKFVKVFKLKCELESPDNLHYFSSKSSPIGQSTFSSALSILNLGYDQMQCIINLSLDSKTFTSFYNYCFNNYKILQKVIKVKNRLITGKLAIINDPELKLRVIAMLDYHSQ